MQEIPQDLLVRLQQQDEAAFEEVYKLCAGFVYNVALRILGSREDAQEAAQDVFVTIYRKAKSFRFESSFTTWVYRITVNTALNYSRRGARMKKQSVPLDEELGSGIQAPGQAGGKIDEEEQAKLVDSLLAAVRPDMRACLVMREMEGLSYQQIAQSLKININTVRSRLARARRQLLSLGKRVGYAGV